MLGVKSWKSIGGTKGRGRKGGEVHFQVMGPYICDGANVRAV